jgi:hypothetical protein
MFMTVAQALLPAGSTLVSGLFRQSEERPDESGRGRHECLLHGGEGA